MIFFTVQRKPQMQKIRFSVFKNVEISQIIKYSYSKSMQI